MKFDEWRPSYREMRLRGLNVKSRAMPEDGCRRFGEAAIGLMQHQPPA
jgi:hypothetical protein